MDIYMTLTEFVGLLNKRWSDMGFSWTVNDGKYALVMDLRLPHRDVRISWPVTYNSSPATFNETVAEIERILWQIEAEGVPR